MNGRSDIARNYPAAPELEPGLTWLNCDPQSVAAARGRVLALAFWNAGSAFSHNLLQALGRTLQRYRGGLKALAVHVPKFEAERQARMARQAAARLGVACPVAHDPHFVAWRQYRIQGWPSVALIDAGGRTREILAGDIAPQLLESRIGRLLEESGIPHFEPAEPRLDDREPRMALRFPAGLAASGRHLYVADSGHHRILECTLDGHVQRQFGTGIADFRDGPAEEAAFNRPTGLALLGERLYVADSGNHALRCIPLLRGEVQTLLGSGSPGALRAGPVQPGLPLNQPSAVAGSGDRLYLALAGGNQVWEYDLGQQRLRCLAGSGTLGLADGTGEQAHLAQPAGMALVQNTLYVCDAAASALRSVQVSSGEVRTLLGAGLFEYGSGDGPREQARMQYPLAVAAMSNGAALWLADAYNGLIRQLRLGGGPLRTLELPYRLHLPAALAAGAGAVWVANCNAHEILRIDPDSGEVRRIPVAE